MGTPVPIPNTEVKHHGGYGIVRESGKLPGSFFFRSIDGIMKFILSTNEDLSPLIEIIKERIEWMDDSKINQWNKTDYLSVFPLQYFIEQQKLERLYLVKDTKDKIIGGAIILTKDERWNDNKEGIYIHNLVSKLSCKGVGKFIIDQCVLMAKQYHFDVLRLDSDIHNQKLLNYYHDLGFEIKGTIEIGTYIGYLQELYIKSE